MKPITLFLLCGALLAQTHGVAIPDPSANLPAQTIGPRDLIVLQVYDSPELSRTVRIGADGMIRLPMVKQKIKAELPLPPGFKDELKARWARLEAERNAPTHQ